MEIYKGTKFNLKITEITIPEHQNLEQLKFWCSVFNKNNYAPQYAGGSSGNLSFRTKSGENSFIITASHTALQSNMSDSDFVFVKNCDINKNTVWAKGEKAPSSESILHFAIYESRPEINVIFHGHSPEILKNSMNLEVPTTKTVEEYGTIELVNSVLEIMENHKFFILKEHGFVSLGENFEEAGLLITNYKI